MRSFFTFNKFTKVFILVFFAFALFILSSHIRNENIYFERDLSISIHNIHNINNVNANGKWIIGKNHTLTCKIKHFHGCCTNISKQMYFKFEQGNVENENIKKKLQISFMKKISLSLVIHYNFSFLMG